MPEFSFVAHEYDVLTMSLASHGDISVLDIRAKEVDGHGTLASSIRITTAPWVKLPVGGQLKFKQDGARFELAFSKGVSRAYFDHVYQMLVHEKPVTVEASYSGEQFVPFGANNPAEDERDVSFVRFKVGNELVGEIEEIRDLL